MVAVSAALRLQAPVGQSCCISNVLLALLFMLVWNGTEYKYRGAVYDGAALGPYVAMASTTRLPTIPAFVAANI